MPAPRLAAAAVALVVLHGQLAPALAPAAAGALAAVDADAAAGAPAAPGLRTAPGIPALARVRASARAGGAEALVEVPTVRGGRGLAGVRAAVGAQVAAGVQAAAEAARRQAELVALRAEIGKLTARLEEARHQQSGIEGELGAADLALQLETERLAEAVTARDAAAARQAESEAAVRDLDRALTEKRQEFERQMVTLYRLGGQGYLRLFSLLKPNGDLLLSIRMARYLVRHDRQVMESYQEAKDRLARRQGELAAERLERESWLARERERRTALVAARERKAEVLARLEREQSALSVRAADLAERERKLSAFLDLLYGRSPAELAGTPMQQFRGVLDWPVAGTLVDRFGPHLDPRYRTRVPHNGIDLATTAGAEVKAVYPGKVLYAAPFEGYGLTAVVHHPGRVFTLYAGLSELRKGKDDMVSLGDLVGLAADRLYFEIRVENHPEDPLTWLHSWVH